MVLIAHDVEGQGGMERSLVENVLRGSSEVSFCVVSSTLEPALRAQVEWKRVPVPRRPLLLKFVAFYLLGAVQVARAGPGLRQSTGAIVPNCADIAVIHFCHAGYLAKAEGTAAMSLSRAKRWHVWLIRRVSRWAERWSYRARRLRWFVAVSEGVRLELEQFYPGLPCEVAPNGVDHHRFRPDPEARAQLRRQVGAARDDLIAVFVGGDWARKGVDMAISAIAEARRSQRAPVNLWIVGPGEQLSYRALAREEGVERHVCFFGWRSDTERFYKAADVFILPSLYETFSLAAVEAAACGLPIVTTSRDGVFQELERTGAALVCDRSPAALAGALGLLAHDRARREAVGRVAREQSTRYTWERQASTLVTLYARLVQEARPSAAYEPSSTVARSRTVKLHPTTPQAVAEAQPPTPARVMFDAVAANHADQQPIQLQVNENPDVRTYVRAVRQRAWLIALVVVLATAATYAYYSTRPRHYEATTTLLAEMSPLERALVGDPGIQIDANEVAVLLQSGQVRDAVARKVGGVSGSVRTEVGEAQPGLSPNIIRLTATASTAAGAELLANTYATTFSSLTATEDRQQITDARKRAEAELRELEQREADPGRQRDLSGEIRRLTRIEQLPAVGTQQIDPAVAPSAPTEHSPYRNALFALVVSLALAAGGVYLLVLFDRRVRGTEELERVYGLPVLGTIPRDSNASRADGDLMLSPPLREPFRKVRINLQLRAGDRRLRTVLVTSAVSGEGRSTVVRNLALEYRAAGRRAAVIDADVTDPRLAELFLVEGEPGLTDVLTGARGVSEALQPAGVRPGAAGVHNGGASDPSEPSGSIAVLSRGSASEGLPAAQFAETMKPVLDDLGRAYDVVLIDSPALLPLSDSLQLLSAVDGVLIVAGIGQLTRDVASEARGVLEQLKDVELLGVVANKVRRRRAVRR